MQNLIAQTQPLLLISFFFTFIKNLCCKDDIVHFTIYFHALINSPISFIITFKSIWHLGLSRYKLLPGSDLPCPKSQTIHMSAFKIQSIFLLTEHAFISMSVWRMPTLTDVSHLTFFLFWRPSSSSNFSTTDLSVHCIAGRSIYCCSKRKHHRHLHWKKENFVQYV